jgi:hypothetical protein
MWIRRIRIRIRIRNTVQSKAAGRYDTTTYAHDIHVARRCLVQATFLLFSTTQCL